MALALIVSINSMVIVGKFNFPHWHRPTLSQYFYSHYSMQCFQKTVDDLIVSLNVNFRTPSVNRRVAESINGCVVSAISLSCIPINTLFKFVAMSLNPPTSTSSSVGCEMSSPPGVPEYEIAATRSGSLKRMDSSVTVSFEITVEARNSMPHLHDHPRFYLSGVFLLKKLGKSTMPRCCINSFACIYPQHPIVIIDFSRYKKWPGCICYFFYNTPKLSSLYLLQRLGLHRNKRPLK